MAKSRRATVVPAPVNILPSQSFMGDDGKWSTFTVSVGTPPQNFRVLPSTQVSETWVILPDGCIASDPSDCQTQRGGENFNGQSPKGFLSNQSSTWQQLGLYTINTESVLNITGVNGLFGNDTVGLNGGNGSTVGAGLSLAKQTVGGIAAKDYFLGLLGLSIAPSSFSSAANPAQTFLTNLFKERLIPSLSYGYTAGASYGTNGQDNWGSLVLGGYDTTKYDMNNQISMAFSSQDTRALTVGVQSIIGTNVNNGTASFTTNGGHLSLIDSTLSHIWLPQDVCDQMAGNLGLVYDPQTDLYVLNSTQHAALVAANPSFTFKIGQTAFDNGNSVSISFPYAAFDLQIGWPVYDRTVNYFPIRRGNSSQYTLGRSFLQQAYIIVDYDNSNFTVAPATFPDTTVKPHLVAIVAQSNNSGKPSSLSTGAIVGIAVGGIILLVLAIFALFWFLRRRRRKPKATKPSELHANELGTDSTYSKVHEADGDQVMELPTGQEAYGKQTRAELDTSAAVFEMEGDSGTTLAPHSAPSLDSFGRAVSPNTNTSGRRSHGSTPFSPASDQYSPAQPSPMSRGELSPH